jgi:hypothetical protein
MLPSIATGRFIRLRERESSMTSLDTNANASLRELTANEMDLISGARLASPTFSFEIFGYGIQWNSRTVCVLTPEGSTCTNIPKS